MPATLPPYPLDALVINDAEVEYLLELEDQDDHRRRRRRRSKGDCAGGDCASVEQVQMCRGGAEGQEQRMAPC